MRSCGCACSDHPYFRTTHNARRPDAAAYPQHINDLDGRQLTVALYAMALCWRGLSRRRPLPAQYLLHYRLASRRTCAAPPPPGAFSSGEHSPRTGHPVRRWCVGSRSVLHTASATARRRTVSERRIPPGATAGPCSLQMHCCCPPPLVIAFHRPVEDSATGREVWGASCLRSESRFSSTCATSASRPSTRATRSVA